MDSVKSAYRVIQGYCCAVLGMCIFKLMLGDLCYQSLYNVWPYFVIPDLLGWTYYHFRNFHSYRLPFKRF